MKKIAFIVATPITINAFMRNHIKTLAKEYKITVIANENLAEIDVNLPVEFIHCPILRDISIFKDTFALFALWVVLSRQEYDAIHTITPKAALVGMIAGRLSGVKNRFHTYTGQVWCTKKGINRFLLKTIDKLVFRLSTFVLVDSHSQRKFLLDNNVVNSNRSRVLASGSISGVDVEKFKFSNLKKESIRADHSIPASSFVFTFLGRLCKDKGIEELILAFKNISLEYPNAYLMLVGPNEGKYDEMFFNSLKNLNIIYCGPTERPQDYFSASDCLVLPSYREGFGTTVLEAASCGIPTLASNIYGLSDAVIDNVTGLLHTVRSEAELGEHMKLLLEDPQFSRSLGDAAFERVKTKFSSKILEQSLQEFYRESIGV